MEVGAETLSTMSLVLAHHFDFLSSPLRLVEDRGVFVVGDCETLVQNMEEYILEHAASVGYW